MFYDKLKHHIGIKRTDGTEVGLMLALDNNKAPMYRTITERYLKNQYYAGAPDYGALDPESELPIILYDFRSGFGFDYADSADPFRYFASYGMDLSNKGMAIAGNTPTAQAVPDKDFVPVIANGNMEAATGGFMHHADFAQSTTQKKTLTASIRTVKSSDIADDLYLEGWTPGVQYTFTCWLYGYSANDRIRIQIADGTQTDSSAYSESAAWVEKTAQITVASTATYLKITLDCDKQGGVACYADDASITMDSSASAVTYTGVTRAFADYNDDFYYSLDKYLIRMDATTGTSYLVWQYAANITDLEPFTDDKLYVALGLSTAYENITATFDADGSTTNGGTYVFMQFLKTVFTTADTMYGNDENNKIRSTVDPADSGTDFSNPAITVGSDANDITGLEEKSGALYIAKQDMTYYLDSSSAVQRDLAPELKTDTAATSGKAIFLWNKNLYINAGDQVLLETDGTTNTFRNPANYCTNLSDFVGAIQGLAGDGFWLFAIVDNDTKVEVLKGRDEVVPGSAAGSTASWVWHPFAEITLGGCEKAFVSSVYQKRLWISSTTSTDSLYYIPLPAGYGNITSDANRLFNISSPYFETPFMHGGFRGEDKGFYKATMTLGHSYDVDIYFELHYKKLGDSSYTKIADFKGTSDSRIVTEYIPAASDETKPTSPFMRFKVVAKTDTTNTTPILLNLDIRAVLYPKIRRIIECAVRCEDGIQDKDGMPLEGTDAAYIEETIEDAQEATWPFTFWTLKGREKTVKMLPSEPLSAISKDLKNEKPEEIIWLRLLEVKTNEQ